MKSPIELEWSSRSRRAVADHFGLDRLPSERREDVLAELITLIEQGIEIRMGDQITDKDADDFEALITSEGVNSFSCQQFMRARFPNLPAMLAEEILHLETMLKYPLIDRAYTDDTPSQKALNDGTDLTADLGSTVAGHGVLFNTAALAIGLAFDPAHHRRTPVAKKHWRVKRFISWMASLSAQLWIDVIFFILLMHFQRTGKINAIPGWALVWVPVWFARRGLAIQLLLSLIVPVGTMVLIILILAGFKLRLRKQFLNEGESK